jgi:hypothetical protein
MCACAGSPAGHHPVRAGRLLDAAAREAAHHAAGVQPRHQGRVPANSHFFENFAKYWYIIMPLLRTVVSQHNCLRNFVKMFIMQNYCTNFGQTRN